MPQMHCHRNQHWERIARGKMFKEATPRWPGIRCNFGETSNIWRAKMFSVPATLLIPTIWHYRKRNFVSFLKFCLSLICAINFLMIFVIPLIHNLSHGPDMKAVRELVQILRVDVKLHGLHAPGTPRHPFCASPPSAWTLLCTALMAWVKGRCSTVQQWQYIVDMFVTALLQARSGKQLNPSMDGINDLNGGHYCTTEVDHW